MSKRLYVAYGSNLNIRQMQHRCPTAKLYGTGIVSDYELQFKGQPNCAFATIAPKEGAEVPVAVWEIQPQDERSLDRYEGYPSHYFKQNVPVQLDGEEINAMVYIMNLKMGFGLPSPYYYQTVYDGYNDCGLDNPTKSDGNNLLHLVNKYMNLHKATPGDVAYKPKSEKYAKIISKTLIYGDGDASAYGQNAFFYDSAEGLLTSVILLIAEFAEPKERISYRYSS